MQSADFLSAVFFYLKVGENLNQNWIVENLNNAFSTWNGKLGELWGLVTTGPQTFKGGAVWSVMQTLHNGMVGIGYALVVLFFAISLCKNTMNFHELKRPEAAIHYFLRFVAAKALVGYGQATGRRCWLSLRYIPTLTPTATLSLSMPPKSSVFKTPFGLCTKSPTRSKK